MIEASFLSQKKIEKKKRFDPNLTYESNLLCGVIQSWLCPSCLTSILLHSPSSSSSAPPPLLSHSSFTPPSPPPLLDSRVDIRQSTNPIHLPFICHLSTTYLTINTTIYLAFLLPFYLHYHLAHLFVVICRAIDSHLLVVPGFSAYFGSEAKMNSRYLACNLCLPSFLPLAPLHPKLGTPVICRP